LYTVLLIFLRCFLYTGSIIYFSLFEYMIWTFSEGNTQKGSGIWFYFWEGGKFRPCIRDTVYGRIVFVCIGENLVVGSCRIPGLWEINLSSIIIGLKIRSDNKQTTLLSQDS